MNLHKKHHLTRVINAAGTFTPLGVSRSSPMVCDTVAGALSEFFVMDELQHRASQALARFTGAEAGAVTHCVSAGIALSIAGIIAGSDPARVANLPVSGQPAYRVVLPACHAINYGHEITQDIRLTGAEPVLAGDKTGCTIEQLDTELSRDNTTCLLLVSSRLVTGTLDLKRATECAHAHNIPTIIDGAAQDMRIPELLATTADIVLVSAHKYLASPTAGLIIGSHAIVRASLAQEKGIGRAMKASKEAILGVLAAIEVREGLDLTEWRLNQNSKLDAFIADMAQVPGITAKTVADPAGMPFSRAHLHINPVIFGMDAYTLSEKLKRCEPSIRVMAQEFHRGTLILELVPLTASEIEDISKALKSFCLSP